MNIMIFFVLLPVIFSVQVLDSMCTSWNVRVHGDEVVDLRVHVFDILFEHPVCVKDEEDRVHCMHDIVKSGPSYKKRLRHLMKKSLRLETKVDENIEMRSFIPFPLQSDWHLSGSNIPLSSFIPSALHYLHPDSNQLLFMDIIPVRPFSSDYTVFLNNGTSCSVTSRSGIPKPSAISIQCSHSDHFDLHVESEAHHVLPQNLFKLFEHNLHYEKKIFPIHMSFLEFEPVDDMVFGKDLIPHSFLELEHENFDHPWPFDLFTARISELDSNQAFLEEESAVDMHFMKDEIHKKVKFGIENVLNGKSSYDIGHFKVSPLNMNKQKQKHQTKDSSQDTSNKIFAGAIDMDLYDESPETTEDTPKNDTDPTDYAAEYDRLLSNRRRGEAGLNIRDGGKDPGVQSGFPNPMEGYDGPGTDARNVRQRIDMNGQGGGGKVKRGGGFALCDLTTPLSNPFCPFFWPPNLWLVNLMIKCLVPAVITPAAEVLMSEAMNGQQMPLTLAKTILLELDESNHHLSESFIEVNQKALAPWKKLSPAMFQLLTKRPLARHSFTSMLKKDRVPLGTAFSDELHRQVQAYLAPAPDSPFSSFISLGAEQTAGSQMGGLVDITAWTITAALAGVIPDILVPLLIEGFVEEVVPRVHDSVEDALKEPLYLTVTGSLSKQVTAAVSLAVGTAVPSLIERILPTSLFMKMTEKTTKTLTRSVTHAVTSTLVNRLNADMDLEQMYVCYYCKHSRTWCDRCKSENGLGEWMDFARYYSDHAAAYYSDYYGEMFGWPADQMLEKQRFK